MSRDMSSCPILIIEDSDEDFEFAEIAFENANMNNPIFRCVDGEEALDFLRQEGKYVSDDVAPRPSLILLDLNLPGTDGREVLSEIKSDPSLRAIPVIVLSTSSDDQDIESCYQEGASSYMQKPVNLDGFFKAISNLKHYWLESVMLPCE